MASSRGHSSEQKGIGYDWWPRAPVCLCLSWSMDRRFSTWTSCQWASCRRIHSPNQRKPNHFSDEDPCAQQRPFSWHYSIHTWDSSVLDRSLERSLVYWRMCPRIKRVTYHCIRVDVFSFSLWRRIAADMSCIRTAEFQASCGIWTGQLVMAMLWSWQNWASLRRQGRPWSSYRR